VAPGEATREQTPGLWLILKKPLSRLSLKRLNFLAETSMDYHFLKSNKHNSKPGSSLATTTPLVTVSSDSLEVLELLLSLKVSLEIHVVKHHMYFCTSEYTYFI